MHLHGHGWILLGPRPDGSFHGRDEREALAELADPIARAVQIVLTREVQEAEAQRERSEMLERLADMALRLEAVERAIAKPPRRKRAASTRSAECR